MPTVLADAHNRPWLLLGATGLTGRMVLEHAIAAGMAPVLAGRDLGRLKAIADPLGLECVAIDLTDSATLVATLSGKALVLNAAGPFATTAAPVIEAALAAGVDYIDLNGEYATLAMLLALGDRARSAGVALIGGAGFGVAATDGIAMQVDAALGGADSLRISVATDSGFSTAAVADSTIEVLRGGGIEVSDGRAVARPIARRRWNSLGATGPVAFASAPLADLAAARAATGAREIVAGVPMPAMQARVVATIAPLLPYLLRVPAIARAMANTGGHAGVSGHDRTYRSMVEVVGTKGKHCVTARLETGEAFAIASDIALLAVQTALASRPGAGAHTPATAFGADFIARVPGVSITLTEDHNAKVQS